MICYPESASHTQPDLDQKTIITRILEVCFVINLNDAGLSVYLISWLNFRIWSNGL